MISLRFGLLRLLWEKNQFIFFGSLYSVGYLREQEFSKIFKNIPKKKLCGLRNCVNARDPNNMLISYSQFVF